MPNRNFQSHKVTLHHLSHDICVFAHCDEAFAMVSSVNECTDTNGLLRPFLAVQNRVGLYATIACWPVSDNSIWNTVQDSLVFRRICSSPCIDRRVCGRVRYS